MEKISLTNIFLDTKKSLNLKGYVFTIFLTVIFLLLPKYIIDITNIDQIANIGIMFWFVLLSVIFTWIFIFKRKIFLNRENILNFIINNVLIMGVLICIKNFLNTLGKRVFLEGNSIFLITYFFANKITSIFLFFTAVSGILTLIGKEKISFIESGKIFKNSFGKFFTILFFWLFYELYGYECINIGYLMLFSTDEHFYSMFFSANENLYIYQLIISRIIELLFDSYIFYFFLVFVSSIFKNYLEKSQIEEIYEDKTSVPVVFERTMDTLKGRKFKFFGTIIGIYFLCGITVSVVSCFFADIMSNSFFYYSLSISGIIAAVIVIYGIMILFQIFITKSCFKFLGEFTEKIDFSKFMKIYGYGIAVTILAIIAGTVLTFVTEYLSELTFVIEYLSESNYKLSTLYNGIIYFTVFYFTVIHYMITAFILTGQKGNIKKSFKESLKFFSWKFIPVILGMYKLNGQILEKLYFSHLDLQEFAAVLCDIVMLFVTFAFSNIIVLAVINYIIETKNKD